MSRITSSGITTISQWSETTSSIGGRACNYLYELENRVIFCEANFTDRVTTIFNEVYIYDFTKSTLTKVIKSSDFPQTISFLQVINNNVYILTHDSNYTGELFVTDINFKNFKKIQNIPKDAFLLETSIDNNYFSLFSSPDSGTKFLDELNLQTNGITNNTTDKKAIYKEDLETTLSINKIMNIFLN
jgi:hypothetical protein